MRLILVTFAFLALVFYQLSGGADFEPRAVRTASVDAPPVKAAPKPEPVSLVSVQPTTLVRKQAPTKPKPKQAEAPAPEPELTTEEATERLAQVGPSLQGTLTLAPATSDDGALTLASLQQAPEPEPTEPFLGADTVTAVEPTRPDIREVSGTRVNMRDGPGTIYPVIARLNIGHKVEVLGESGTGWLRLRVLPEQHVGWISASLISKKAP